MSSSALSAPGCMSEAHAKTVLSVSPVSISFVSLIHKDPAKEPKWVQEKAFLSYSVNRSSAAFCFSELRFPSPQNGGIISTTIKGKDKIK